MQSLDELIESYRSILIAEKHLQSVNNELNKLYGEIEPLARELDAQADVLEKEQPENLRRLFSRTLVSEEEQHEIEKQQYLLTALKYRQHKETIDLLEFEKNILVEKLKTKIDIEAKLNLAIETEQMQIQTKYPQVQRRLFEINEALKDLINYRREVFEARGVTTKVIGSLQTMHLALKKAQEFNDWGEYYLERLEGKKRKHEHVDLAHHESIRTIQLMKRLKSELEDIIEFKPMTKMYAFDELLHFQDYFNEGLITDWIVKNNVIVSLHKVTSTLNYVQRIVASLDKYKLKAESKYKQLKDSKLQVVENAAPQK